MVTLAAREAVGQWTETSFSDSIGIHALLTNGERIFLGCGGPLPVPAAPGPTGRLVFRTAPQEIEQEFGAGAYVSTDSGATWSSSGLEDTTVLAFAAIGNELIASTLSAGVFRSTNNGVSWIPADSGLGSALVLSLAAGPSRVGGMNIYAGTFGEGFYISSDSGSTWTQVSNLLDSSSSIVTFLAASGPTLFASTWRGSLPVYDAKNGLYKSTDYGITWNVADTLFGNLSHIQCIFAGANEVLAGMSSGLYMSQDNGNTWTDVDSTNAFISIVSTGGYLLAGTDHGVYFSSDNGAVWSPADSGLGDTTTMGMLGATSTEVAAVGGAYYRGLPNPFAGVNAGVWLRPASQLTAVEENPRVFPSRLSLSQNYPNPFNPSTTINYQLPVTGAVDLVVYDILGRKVATLVSGRQAAGEHSVTFDAAGFPSGVYLYTIHAEGYSEVRKMVLVK